MTNAIEQAKDLLKAMLENEPDELVADGGITMLMVWRKDATRALAALSAPTVSGLTEEERAKGQKLLADWKALTQRWSDAEDARSPDAEVTILSRRMETAKDILKAFLLFHAEALLSPAPGIDWKRVAEVRERHEYAEQKGGDLYTAEYCEWTFSQTHADRAFLLSLLPKQETNDGQ